MFVIFQSSFAVSADGGGRRGPDSESDVRLFGQVCQAILDVKQKQKKKKKQIYTIEVTPLLPQSSSSNRTLVFIPQCVLSGGPRSQAGPFLLSVLPAAHPAVPSPRRFLCSTSRRLRDTFPRRASCGAMAHSAAGNQGEFVSVDHNIKIVLYTVHAGFVFSN